MSVGRHPRSLARRASIAALVLTAAGLGALSPAGPAPAARAAQWSPEPATFGVGENRDVPVTMSDGTVRFVPRRVVGFLGREPDTRPFFLSIFPLSQLPRAGAFRETLRVELARRGEAPPLLRVPR